MALRSTFAPALVLTSLLICGSVGADIDAYSAGRQAYDNGAFDTARDFWLQAAETGDARAEFAMGTLYERGEGVDPAPSLATAWYLRAARHGFAPAQFNLGNAYHRGRGVPQDVDEAVYWWARAAAADFAPAQFNLASHYLETGTDHVEAMKWLARAAANGHPEARQLLQQQPAPDPAPSAPIAREPDAPLHDAQWLLAQDPAAYTLQVAAMSSNERLLGLASELAAAGELAWFEFQRDGRPLYVLVQGIYDTPDQARAAARRLPTSLRSDQPWPRRLGEVQALIGG